MTTYWRTPDLLGSSHSTLGPDSCTISDASGILSIAHGHCKPMTFTKESPLSFSHHSSRESHCSLTIRGGPHRFPGLGEPDRTTQVGLSFPHQIQPLPSQTTPSASFCSNCVTNFSNSLCFKYLDWVLFSRLDPG